jgi:hypothetical protein
MVYLLLYVVIGVRESIGIVEPLWKGGTSDFNLFHDPFRIDTGGKTSDVVDFQMFFASGLCVIIMVRVMAVRLRIGLRAQALPSKE